jgi:hypothetical protein
MGGVEADVGGAQRGEIGFVEDRRAENERGTTRE